MYIPAILDECKEEIRKIEVSKQEVPFDRDAWNEHITARELEGIKIDDLFDGIAGNTITREDIFDRAPSDPTKLVHCSPADASRWIRFFILVMIWGYGTTDRRGPWRVNQMLHTPGFIKILCQAGEDCFYGLFLKAYGTLHGIKHVGPAYASKLLYFYTRNFNADTKPLILDSVVVSSLRAINWPQQYPDFIANGINPKYKNPASYGQYLLIMHNWAQRLQCTPDQLEYFLWKNGKKSPTTSLSSNYMPASGPNLSTIGSSAKCPQWKDLSKNTAFRKTSGISIKPMGGRAQDIYFRLDSKRNQVEVWRIDQSLRFRFGEPEFMQILHRYQQGIEDGSLPLPPKLGGASYFNNPKWSKPPLGQNNTPYAAAVVRHLWR